MIFKSGIGLKLNIVNKMNFTDKLNSRKGEPKPKKITFDVC